MAWTSHSNNLDPLDEHNHRDTQIYVRDLATGTNTLVTLRSDEAAASAITTHGPPAISADGSIVAWASPGDDLHPDDTDTRFDIFVRDLDNGPLGATSLESRNSLGVKANSGGAADPHLSGDGRFVTFASNATNLDPVDDSPGGTSDIFRRDRDGGTTNLVTVPLAGQDSDEFDDSNFPRVSDDGRFVAFDSDSNVLAADKTSLCVVVFARDMQTGTTSVVSRASGANGAVSNSCNPIPGGAIVPAMTPDGRYVAYNSSSTNLHPDDLGAGRDIYLRDVLGEPPVAVADSVTLAQDAPATAIDVLANDTDLDGGEKAIVTKTNAPRGQVALTGGGTGLTYQPDAGFCNAPGGATDNFTYTLNRGSIATVSVTVTCAPQPDPGGGGGGGGGGGDPTPLADTTAPGVDIGGRKKVAVLSRLFVKLSADEACVATLGGKAKVRMTRGRGRAGQRTFSLKPTLTELAAGSTELAKPKLGSKARKALKSAFRAGYVSKLNLTASCVDTAGNAGSDSHKIRVKQK